MKVYCISIQLPDTLNLRFASQEISCTGKIKMIQTFGLIHWVRDEEVNVTCTSAQYEGTAVHCHQGPLWGELSSDEFLS